MPANTPEPPYYAVIFSTTRTEGDNGYEEMADRMMQLAAQQDGFLGVETARSEEGLTVSYWKDLESIQQWRENSEHQQAKQEGKEVWYKLYKTRIAKVERDY